MRMVSIASGSSGNCIYIGSDNTHVLVDAGISNKRIEMGLNDLGLNARELDGISSRMNIPTISKGSACWRANMAHLFTAQKRH